MSIKDSFEEWKKNLGDTRPWDLLDPNVPKVSDEVAEERLFICKSCPELIKMSKQCKKCGCFMSLKVKLEGAECPIQKW